METSNRKRKERKGKERGAYGGERVAGVGDEEASLSDSAIANGDALDEAGVAHVFSEDRIGSIDPSVREQKLYAIATTFCFASSSSSSRQ
jgi:hypothetical protein